MFTPTWGKTVGGTAKVARGLVDGLKLVVPSSKFFIVSPDTGPELESDVECIDGKTFGSRLLFAFLALYRIRPTVIHCQGRVHQLLIGFIYKKIIDGNVKLLCSFCTQPTVRTFLPGVSVRVSQVNKLFGRIKNLISVFLLNRADLVVANSASLAENMIALLGPRFHRPFAVITSGVEVPEASAADIEDFIGKYKLTGVSPIFLTVGVFSWDWKVAGILLLLDSFKEVARQYPSARLIIVGDGPYKSLVQSKIDALSLQEQVVLTGNLQNTFVPIAASHIYCHLALNESCSVSIIEAMVSGKPIIVSRAGGNSELITDNETGLVVEPTVQDVQAAMLRLARDKDLSNKFGIAARLVAAERYSWRVIASQYSCFYLGATCASGIQFVRPKERLIQ